MGATFRKGDYKLPQKAIHALVRKEPNGLIFFISSKIFDPVVEKRANIPFIDLLSQPLRHDVRALCVLCGQRVRNVQYR